MNTETYEQDLTAAERQKRINARNKERRATLIVGRCWMNYVQAYRSMFLHTGLIMGSFIACWFPFFFLYSISPVCPICETKPDRCGTRTLLIFHTGIRSPCCVHSWGFSFAFWLGYSNSALNPVSFKSYKPVGEKILLEMGYSSF